ncbi:NAD(P)-binding protein [Hesseltinella vesiculosa]|uniref:NAD(P)-binding protein n=1 Tax=Hesseltinella vesiculosa TaxID=101127 RepID=A0A1X2G606_9FUNG|nr:NAD(P)-binding protein [Hesseltinella vesiculosa]
MTNDNKLQGKVAVLTGASRGIGKEVADALVSKGCKVVIGDILDKDGESVIASYNAEGNRAVYLHTDVTKYSDNVALFKLAEKEFGGVDIVVLNAGIIGGANNLFGDFDDERDSKMMDINVTSVIKGTKVATLALAKRGGGVIVNTASIAGLFANIPHVAPYTASKHAVVGYTRSLDLLKVVCGVRCNAVCPYWVETKLLHNLHRDTQDIDPIEKLVANSPRTKMETVVEAFMLAIEDETRVGQTLVALPDGIQVHERPQSYPSCKVPDEFIQTFIQESIVDYKNQLAVALERYESM